jgi:hypothetical protein
MPEEPETLNEKTWVQRTIDGIREQLPVMQPALRIECGKKLPYAFEIRNYRGDDPEEPKTVPYETDILISEVNDDLWKPRVVIEAKLGKITTHDAITYSTKASTHKHVHPYLRYGILIGNRGHYPLPGRLFRHGAYFDFMLSAAGTKLSKIEVDQLLGLIQSEVEASRKLEDILYTSRKPGRSKYTLLHKPLILE